MLIVREERASHHDEALAAVAEFGGEEAFPAQQYEAAAIRALIHGRRGDGEAAGTYARRALEAAARADSGFRYHPRLGLVRNPEARMHRQLQRWAAGQ